MFRCSLISDYVHERDFFPLLLLSIGNLTQLSALSPLPFSLFDFQQTPVRINTTPSPASFHLSQVLKEDPYIVFLASYWGT